MSEILIHEIAEHFSERSGGYDDLGTWSNSEAVLSAMVSFLPKAETTMINVVDFGAGTGAVSKHILEGYHCPIKLTALDICEDMLKKIENPLIEKCVASLEVIPYDDNVFDVGVSRQCLHYIDDLETVINEIRRVIKKGGTFILSQIVPLDGEAKAHWKKTIQYRQPLRKQYFSESQWIEAFTSRGFVFESIKNFSHRGFVSKWVRKYNITDQTIMAIVR